VLEERRKGTMRYEKRKKAEDLEERERENKWDKMKAEAKMWKGVIKKRKNEKKKKKKKKKENKEGNNKDGDRREQK
jgi:hypothetical protein